jgi:hypothetical protein
LADALSCDLLDRLRTVLAGGHTTESGLRELTNETGDLVRDLRTQLRASERRIRRLNADPRSPISEIAKELRRVETLRPRLSEAGELVTLLEARGRELRTDWLLRQADARRAS